MDIPAFGKWGRRLKRIEEKEEIRDRLKQRVGARQTEIWNWRSEVAARIDVSTSCDNLAGYIELYRRAPDNIKAMLADNYRALLRILVEGDPTLNRPFYVDFNALPVAARPYVLAPFLGHRVGNLYPMLCLARSDPSKGVLTFLMLGGPTDLAFWKSSLPTISAWLGGHWGVGSHTVDTIMLVRREPLPSVFPLNRRLLTNKGLFLGVDVDTGAAVHMPFADLTSGTFIPGASGTGKSTCQHVLVQSLLANLDQFAAVYLVDGKDGVAFNRYRNAAPGKVHVIWDEADVWSLCSELVSTMRARNAEQRERGTDNATENFIALVIDEMSTFTVKPSSDPKSDENKRHARFLDELAMLARRGRSTGLRLFITAQEPVAEQIPATVRANCLTTISFKLPIDAHATAVFGQLDGLPADPRQLQRGRALLKNGMTGEIRHVQFPVLGQT